MPHLREGDEENKMKHFDPLTGEVVKIELEEINCLKCRKPFKTVDRCRNRICSDCNSKNLSQSRMETQMQSAGKTLKDSR